MQPIRMALLACATLTVACGGDAVTTLDAGLDGGGPGDGGGDAAEGCTARAGYSEITAPSATFVANFDDNGETAGDPIPGNDFMTFGAIALAGPMPDRLFVDLYEGYGRWAEPGGAVIDFASATLPLTIDFATSPAETRFETCGVCVNLLNGIDSSGEEETVRAALLAQSGALEITALPTAAGQPFSANLLNVVLAEMDREGGLVPGGCTTTIRTLAVTAIAEAAPAAKPSARR